MAGFGFLKPKTVSVGADETPSLRDLPMQDKLFALSAILQGDTQTLMQIPMLAAARAQAARQKGLDQELSDYVMGRGRPELVRTPREQASKPEEPVPGATPGLGIPIPRIGGNTGDGLKVPDVGVDVPNYSVNIPTRNGPPNLRDALPLLMRRRAAGLDIRPDIELLDKAGPQYDYVNGVRVDKRSDSGPAFVPSLDKGQEPVYNGRGEIIGVRNMDGSIKAAADMAGATERAKQEASAQYDVVTLNRPDGSTVQVPRDVAVKALLESYAGGAGGDLGRSQTPAAKERDVGQAKTDVERAAAEPKAYAGLQDQARASDLVISTIDKILGDGTAQNPGLVSWDSSGFGANLGGLKGTKAHDLQAALDLIRSNIGFAELAKMRENSPTGGALGAVSERENALLQSTLGSLDPGQSPDQFRASLKQIRGQLAAIRDQRKSAYQATYGAQGAPRRAPTRTEIEAEMRKRGLLQ